MGRAHVLFPCTKKAVISEPDEPLKSRGPLRAHENLVVVQGDVGIAGFRCLRSAHGCPLLSFVEAFNFGSVGKLAVEQQLAEVYKGLPRHRQTTAACQEPVLRGHQAAVFAGRKKVLDVPRVELASLEDLEFAPFGPSDEFSSVLNDPRGTPGQKPPQHKTAELLPGLQVVSLSPFKLAGHDRPLVSFKVELKPARATVGRFGPAEQETLQALSAAGQVRPGLAAQNFSNGSLVGGEDCSVQPEELGWGGRG